MRFIRVISRPVLVLILGLFSYSASAEQSQDFGDYVVHFNALPTSFISSDVAKKYGVTRSKQRILLNVSVLKKVLGTTGQPVTAIVDGTATNLNGQEKKLTMRKVSEGQAIYYLADLRVTDQETLNFVINVIPRGEENGHTVKFRQQFYTD